MMQQMGESHSPFPTSSESVDRALLLASLPSLSAPHFLTSAITTAASLTRKRLVIILFSRHFNISRRSSFHLGISGAQGVSHTEQWKTVQELLTFIYVHATKVAYDMGKVLMEIDVLLKGLNEDIDEQLGASIDIVFRISGDACPVPLPETISCMRHSYLPAGDSNPNLEPDGHSPIPQLPDSPKSSFHPVVALGGTFDHLHAGHKILLSMAAWITSEKLIIGVTDDALLQNKANKHVVEKLPQRMERVREFMTFFKPELALDIVAIDDVYGPTGWDANIQALVISKETASGAAAIASHRQARKLPQLEVFTIDVISSTSYNLDHEDAGWLKRSKLSSTFIREWIVNQSKPEGDEE